MATKIRGITLEIGGDTSGLQTSLRKVNNDLTSTQKQLKDVERLLKLDPGNVDLLRQKQELLSRAVEQTGEKLDTLTDAQKAFVEAGGDVNSDSYKALEREIIATQNSLQTAADSAENFNLSMEKSKATLTDISDKAGSIAEQTSGLSKAAQGVLAGMAGAAGIAIKEFADYEQNLGGVETFFKDSTDIVTQYANEAYKTAGMSANQYMETITSFSAALLSSMGGNTRAAAEMANIAIVDMSDNANKFGTDIESVQSAYQGFAKQNYTMLDNLKLGFAGNKQGMEDLLAEAERLTGVKFDINNFADIVVAIHEVQKNMGIAGTTAEEASSTISGSIATLKAAVENLALGFANADADVGELAKNATESFNQVAENVIPVIEQILQSIPGWGRFALAITAVVAVIAPVASLISSVSAALAAFGVASAPVVGVVLALAAAIALLVANWEKLTRIKERSDKFVSRYDVSANGDLPFPMPGLASGGVLSRGSAYVGEAGPELLTVSAGNAVVQPLTNNYTTNNYNTAPAAGGGQPVDVTLLLDSATLARVMVQPNARAVSLAGESAIH